MPRGGPRPNSGPPLGNLNAYKHGRTSRQHHRLLDLIAADPEAREVLLAIARRDRQRQRRAQREANRLLDATACPERSRRAHQLRERALDVAAARYENDQRIPPLTDTEQPPNQNFS